MTPGDVHLVMRAERESFDGTWPETAFQRELEQNRLARYLLLEATSECESSLLGFAGAWLMVDEAHVVTVGVLPAERRKGYGRALVHSLVAVAAEAGMHVATLECRVSNEAARALYREYGFYEVGTRKRYYADNHEDAVIMTTEELDSPAYRERYARLESVLRERVPGLEIAVTEV